jgi:uncharacterized membrane protein YhaH (DUF805 family)
LREWRLVNLVWLLFGFKGRINRAQFWLGWLVASVGAFMLQFLLGGMLMSMSNPANIFTALTYNFALQWVVMSWIGFALQVKRYHDRGRSGLWTLLPLVPTIMVFASIFAALAAAIGQGWNGATVDLNALLISALASASVWLVILVLVYLFMFVDLGCMPGKPEANRYGNPPSGGLGGGAPVGNAPTSGVTIPGQPSRANAQPAPSAASTLMSAESAIERAIAAQKREGAVPSASLGPRPAMATAQPSSGPRPATPGSFGRRASR